MTWGMMEDEEFGQISKVIRYQGCRILAKMITKSLDKIGLLEDMPNDRAWSSSEELN